MLGARPIPEVVEHATAFVAAVQWACPPGQGGDVLDLGSGGGVPGLVVAVRCPWLRVTLVDRRAKRTDHLERVVRRLGPLGLDGRVAVVCRDVVELSRDAAWRERFDVVVARGFGPPERTLQVAASLVRAEGVIVISEPPAGGCDRWTAELLTTAGVDRVVPPPPGTDGVVVLRRRAQAVSRP